VTSKKFLGSLALAIRERREGGRGERRGGEGGGGDISLTHVIFWTLAGLPGINLQEFCRGGSPVMTDPNTVFTR
jgi:hypothetical protein